ncbi:RidA family protein [Pirellulales bacterium]|nr:RidA family protein [Pirellulales bacterium]
MGIRRYGTGESGSGDQPLPFARAVEADGWLFVSGQVSMENGEIVQGGIVTQAHKAIQNMLAIVDEAGYSKSDIVRCGVWLEDPRDFSAFNKVFAEYFGGEYAPARACVQATMMLDCKVEIDCIGYKEPT